MSIVNQLSYSNRQRDQLSNNRNGFTYAANITVLSFALLLFLTVSDAVLQFRYLCLISLTLGLFSSLFYIIQIKEVKLSEEAKHFDHEYKRITMGEKAAESIEKNKELAEKAKTGKDWKAWLKEWCTCSSEWQ
jgi:Na+/melibiose symporter-like transporter